LTGAGFEPCTLYLTHQTYSTFTGSTSWNFPKLETNREDITNWVITQPAVRQSEFEFAEFKTGLQLQISRVKWVVQVHFRARYVGLKFGWICGLWSGMSAFENDMRGGLRVCINSASIVVGWEGLSLITELMHFCTWVLACVLYSPIGSILPSIRSHNVGHWRHWEACDHSSGLFKRGDYFSRLLLNM
jgi:hypothetical protein